jgi:CelD/BcsL family acetyltransferase involved in cellulose biosynthesis
VKDQPAAYALCACWKGWVGQLKTSHILELGDAGSRVINSSLQRAFQEGYGEYDFLGDAAPHKLRWTDRTRRHAEYWLFARSMRGRALATAKTLGARWRKWRDSGETPSTKDARSEVGEAT